MDKSVGVGADDHAAGDVKHAGAGTEPLAAAIENPLRAGAQLDPLGAFGTRFRGMRRLPPRQKFLADLLGDLFRERIRRALVGRISHASYAQIRPDRARIGPFAEQRDQRIVIGGQVDHRLAPAGRRARRLFR